MSCTKIGETCLRVGERQPIRIPLKGSAFIKFWQKSEIVAAGDFRRPKKENGYEYEATAGGQCAQSEPEWPTTIGEPVADGSVTWTCRAISNSSLARVVQSCAWSSTGTLTFSNEAVVNTAGEQEVSAFASGAVQGETGSIIARITFVDTSIEDALIEYHVD